MAVEGASYDEYRLGYAYPRVDVSEEGRHAQTPSFYAENSYPCVGLEDSGNARDTAGGDQEEEGGVGEVGEW
jgi:hypothetical protein